MTPLHRLSTLATRLSRAVARRLPVWQAVAGGLALALGFWGFTLRSPPQDYAGWFNNLFRTVQLITLHFPTSLEEGIPWQLHVARLAVPVVAALATFNVLVGAVTRPVRLALMPHARGHVIVVGAEQLTEAALTALAEHRRIVVVAPSFDAARRETLEALGLTLVEADPKEPATFTALNLKAAAALFLTARDDLANLDLAMLALAATAGRAPAGPPLALAVLIEREDLARELDAALDHLSRNAHVRYHRLCPDRDSLRLDLATHAPVFTKAGAARASHVLVLGLRGAWPQVLMQLITAAQDSADAAPRLSLVLDEAEAADFAALAAARPDLPLVADIAVHPRGRGVIAEAPTLEAVAARGPVDLAVVLRADAEAVTTALALRRPGTGLVMAGAPVLVLRGVEDRLLARLPKAEGEAPVIPFGGLIRKETIERILDRKGDDLAIALHAHYLAAAPALGAGSSAALAAWDALPENLRDANRATAAHARILMAAAGLTAATVPETPDAALIDRLARIEHRRWMTDRIDRGWTFGPSRDDARRIHPSLKPFDALSPADQEKDRNAVRVLLKLSREQASEICPP